MTRDWHPQLTAALLQPAYWTPTVSHKVMMNSCFTSKAWIQIQINETVASCSVQHSLAAHVLRCGLNIYVWVTCTLNASLSSTADKQWKHPRRMIGSLPVCIADVWTARRFSPGTFQFTGSYLENTSAPPSSFAKCGPLPFLIEKKSDIFEFIFLQICEFKTRKFWL